METLKAENLRELSDTLQILLEQRPELEDSQWWGFDDGSPNIEDGPHIKTPYYDK